MQNNVSQRHTNFTDDDIINPQSKPAFSKGLSEHIATRVLQLCIFPLSARSWWLYISNIQKVYYFSSLVLRYLSTNEISFTIYSERSMTFLGSFDRCNASLVSGTSVSFIFYGFHQNLNHFRFYKLIFQVIGGRIQFTDVTEENSGVYHCTAKTKAGSLEARSALNVGPSSSKRKRKHSGRRNGGHHGANRHRRRRTHANHHGHDNRLLSSERKHHSNTFGTWFSS